MTGLAAYAVHEAEMEIARATAVRALMQTGATHVEAVAAVREHLCTPEARGRIGLALSLDLLALSTVRLSLDFDGFRSGLDRARAGLITLRQLLIETGIYAWVKRNQEWPFCCPKCTAIIPICSNPGPRTKLRCNDCRVQWRPGIRLRRRDAIRTPSTTVFIDECTGLPRTRPWVGGRR